LFSGRFRDFCTLWRLLAAAEEADLVFRFSLELQFAARRFSRIFGGREQTTWL